MHGITELDTMFSVKEKPWHKLGTVLNNHPSIDDAVKYSGLCWEVGLKKVYTLSEETELVAEIEESKAIYRKDTNTVLGVTGNRYQPLQNYEAFKFFQPFPDSGEASLETAGSLFGGKKVFILAKINLPDITIVEESNDQISTYVLLSNSHDGKQAVKVGFTPIRVVCNNTLSMATNSKASKLIRVNHSLKMEENLRLVSETMNLVKQEFEATSEQFKMLANTNVNQEDVKKYFKTVLMTDKDTRTLNQLIELFETGRGNHLEGVRGTMWAAYNAVTEHLQYYSGRSDETRFGSLWLGQNAAKSKRALELALNT